jgi:hypothetical protein
LRLPARGHLCVTCFCNYWQVVVYSQDGAFSEHGYAGIEEDVVKEIADFIKDTK